MNSWWTRHASFTSSDCSPVLSTFGSLFAVLHLCVPGHLPCGLPKVPPGVSGRPALPVEHCHRETGLTRNHDVREELRHPVPVWAERTEVRLGLLLQLHQPLLRHRPVQRGRVLCRPQLGEGGTEPAAGTHPAAGLSAGWTMGSDAE